MIKYFWIKTGNAWDLYKMENDKAFRMRYDPAAVCVFAWIKVRYYSLIPQFGKIAAFEEVVDSLKNEPLALELVLRDI